MATNYSKIKQFLGFFLSIYPLGFLPNFKWKPLNNFKLLIFPALKLFAMYCSFFHLFELLNEEFDIMDMIITLIYIIGYFEWIMIYITIFISNKSGISQFFEHFDSAIEESPDEDVYTMYFATNTKLAYQITRTFSIGIFASGVIITSAIIYFSKNHVPMYYIIPGIPSDSILFYPCNLPIQYITYFSLIGMVFGSDVILIIMFIFCDAELKAAIHLISLTNNPQNSPKNTITLKTINESHLKIIKIAEKLSKFCWQIYFHKFFTIIVYFCLVLIMIQSDDVPLLIPLLGTLMTISEVFILCYFGQTLQDRSQNLPRALYTTNWYDWTLGDQKTLLFLIMIFQRPIKLETFGFGIVSIYTFVQICKASASYATILYALYA
uniref:Odorant receptor n=1 Tax=Lutzomyia longipalpis TaxID=7200 RepID=A0A1B0GLL6_LUTLO